MASDPNISIVNRIGDQSQPRDYGPLVPRSIRENLAFRGRLLERAAKSTELQLAIKRACEWSTTFFCNAVTWTYNPRKLATPKLPFITWPYQDAAFDDLHDAIVHQKDAVIEKARDMGASWICLVKFIHCWLFRSSTTYLAMSRVSNLVDSPGNPDSIFWKFDFVLKHLPSWLVPQHKRTEMHYENHENESTFDGYTTTGDAVVGGRRTAAFFDEFPKVKDAQDVWVQSADMAQCRIFNGTPNGTNNAFYRITQMEHVKHIRFDWWHHPEKARGLYYNAEGKRRSPWYDDEFKRRGCNKREMAAQVDIDYTSSDFQFFDGEEINRLIKLNACEPYHVGDLDGNKFVRHQGGPLSLWLHLQGDRPAPGEYLIGVDVAQGTSGPTGTPSCASVFNRLTGEKVAEYIVSNLPPSTLADRLSDIGRWFHNAKIIWEDNGPGSTFGQRLVSIAYPALYLRRNEKRISRERMDIPGWFPTPENKDNALQEYRRALSAGEFLNRSERALRECLQMIFDIGGHVTHSLSLAKDDPSGAKGNHADRVIADALAWKYASELGKPDVQTVKTDEPGPNSILYRRQRREREDREKRHWRTRRTA